MEGSQAFLLLLIFFLSSPFSFGSIIVYYVAGESRISLFSLWLLAG